MKLRYFAAIVAAALPAQAGAWNEIGTQFVGSAVLLQKGDVCDSTRFPLTPGTCDGSAGNPDWRVEIETAIGRWAAVTGNFNFFTDPDIGAGLPGECSDGDPNSVFFLDDICSFAPFGDSTLAVALTSFFFDGVAIHSDVIFNTAFDWDAFDDAMSNHGGDIDFRRVAVHEFGHVAGLDHPFHDFAIMAPFIQETINSPQPDDVAGMSAIYGASLTFAIPDQSVNGNEEIVHVRRTSAGETVTTIRDSGSGAELRAMTFFNSGFQTVDAVLLPDEDGNGAPELAVLAIRMSDLRSVVQIRNIAGDQLPRTITFAEGYSPVKMLNIGDADGNGVSELAILSVRESDLQPVVEIRNSFGAVGRRDVVFADFTSPVDMEVIVDPLGVDPPRLAVLLVRWSDLRAVVEMRNAFGAHNKTRANSRTGFTPVDIEVVDDGGPKLIFLSTRDTDGRPLLQIKDVVAATAPVVQYLAPGHSPLRVVDLGDADGDGRPDLAILQRRDTDGRVNVVLRNTDGSNQRTFNLNSSFDAVGPIFMLDDTDGDGFAEVGLQLSRQTDARVAVDWKNAAGPNQAALTRVWMSP